MKKKKLNLQIAKKQQKPQKIFNKRNNTTEPYEATEHTILTSTEKYNVNKKQNM